MACFRYGYRYRHRFLIPIIALSVLGSAVCIFRSAMDGCIGVEDIMMVTTCLTGALTVCIGRRRAYRWIAFDHFRGKDYVIYCLLLVLAGSGLIVGLLGKGLLISIAGCAVNVLSSACVRILLIKIRQRNSYIGGIVQKGCIHLR